MGQPNLIRAEFKAQREITTPANSTRQEVADTSIFNVGDTVQLIDTDALGCQIAILGTAVVLAMCPDESVVLDSTVDSTAATGTPYLRNLTLDDGQTAVERFYNKYAQPNEYPFPTAQSITGFVQDSPVPGQTTLTIDAHAGFYAAGDSYDVICDSGLKAQGTVVSVTDTAQEVVIDASIDLTAETGCCLVNTSLTLDEAIFRINTATGDSEVEDEDLGEGDCFNTVFYFSQLFKQNSTKVFIDGVRKKRGACGTRASLTVGVGTSQLDFDSLVMGLDGNSVKVELIDPAAVSQALAVTTVIGAGGYPDVTISVSLATDGGGALTSTAQDVANAINADADANRVVQVLYGGGGAGADGSGIVNAAAATPLAGGLDDGTKDYCEVEQVLNNENSGTGFQIIAFHIRPDERNRMSEPPTDSEEVHGDYKLVA